MKPADKDAVLEKFRAGEADVLVSTTVIEVGVNVPNATIMVIENAERFGLAQLHQLRGRVGRGAHESWCFLMAEPNERLRFLTGTTTDSRLRKRTWSCAVRVSCLERGSPVRLPKDWGSRARIR